MKKSLFFRESELMLQALPEVAKEKCFALKGTSPRCQESLFLVEAS